MKRWHGFQMTLLLCVLLSGTLAAAGSAAAQVVVSLQGEDVVITRLDGTGSQRVRVGDGVRRPLAVAANTAHAYAIIGEDAETGGSEIVSVDLHSAQERERIAVPCCALTLAVTADDRWLAAGGGEGDKGRLYVFDLEAGFSLPRTIETPGRIVREILADGPRFVVASGEPERLPLLSRIFVTVIEDGAVTTEDEIPGRFLLRRSYVGSRQAVVWSDESDNAIVITRLGGRGSQRVEIQPPYPWWRGLGGVLANHASAYASFFPSGGVVRVDLERAQQIDFDIVLVAGEYLDAVTQDDRLLLTMRQDPIGEHPWWGFMPWAYLLTAPGQPRERLFEPGWPLERRVVGSQFVVASIKRFPIPEEFTLSIWDIGTDVGGKLEFVTRHRIPGRLALGTIDERESFVYLGVTQQRPTPTSTPTPSPILATPPFSPAAKLGKDGCSVGATSSGFAWFGLAVLLLVAGRRRRVVLMAIVASLANVAPATAKVIVDGATMRIDQGPLQPLPQPNGPAHARPTSPGGWGEAWYGGIDNDVLNTGGVCEGLNPPPVTYEVELALDVQRNWRPWFDDDVQLLINYLAGTFELINGTLLRDASVRVVITHVHIWYDMEPPPQFRGLEGLKDYWEAT